MEQLMSRPRTVPSQSPVEKKINRELTASGVEDLDDFEGSAEKRLEEMERLVGELLTFAPQITHETYRADRSAFFVAVREIEQRVATLELFHPVFETQVEMQYPRTPFFQKVAVLLLGLFRGLVRESVIIQTFGGNRAKRNALLKGGQKLLEIAKEYEVKIEEVKFLPARIVQRDMLQNNEEYQGIINGLDDARERFRGERDHSLEWDRKMRAKIEKLEGMKERLEEDAWERAKAQYLTQKEK